MNSSGAQDFTQRLLAWFDCHKRPMPWRETTDPYAIWISETMLQQTQVATVIPYYHRFLEKFPTLAALAGAELSEVLALWAGLGYYRRAKNLHAAAREVVERFSGVLPQTVEELMTLPGIGRYTAGAVASIAFQKKAPVLDGNVSRVLARILKIQKDIALPAVSKELWSVAGGLLTGKAAVRPGDFNQAMMELGATVCLPQNPRCDECPVCQMCEAANAGVQNELPIKTKKSPTPKIRRIALVIHRNTQKSATKSRRGAGGEVLLMQRPMGGLWEGMWEFPAMEVSEKIWAEMAETGGRISLPLRNSGKRRFNWKSRIADEVRQRLGICVELDDWQVAIGHQLTHRLMEYQVLRGRNLVSSGEIRLPTCDGGRYQAFRWVRWRDAAGMPMGRIAGKIAEAAGVEGPGSEKKLGRIGLIK
jgi:A/G-specific adenine glycosylase